MRAKSVYITTVHKALSLCTQTDTHTHTRTQTHTHIYIFTTHTHTIKQCSYTECGPHSDPYEMQLLAMYRSVEISFFSSNKSI